MNLARQFSGGKGHPLHNLGKPRDRSDSIIPCRWVLYQEGIRHESASTVAIWFRPEASYALEIELHRKWCRLCKAFSTTKTGRVWLLALKEAGTRMESQGNKPSPLTGAFFLPKGQNQDHRSWFRNLRYCVTTALCSRPASARCLRRSASTAVRQEPPLPIYFVLGRHVSKNTAALRPPRKACFHPGYMHSLLHTAKGPGVIKQGN